MKKADKSRKKWIVGFVLALICTVLWGVVPFFIPQTDPVPATETVLLPEIPPESRDAPSEEKAFALYFRLRDEAMLAREMRTLPLSEGKSAEQQLVEALIGGPAPASLELTGVFNAGTRVVSVTGEGDLLTLTLSRAFLDAPADAPGDWESDPLWRAEVLLRRRLALYAAVTAITDSSAYTAVQFLVQTDTSRTDGQRLERRWLYEDAPGDPVGEPLQREESLLLSHHNTVQIILDSWQCKDFTRLYRFISGRPTEAAFLQRMASGRRALSAFSLSPGVISGDGQSAVIVAQLTYLEAAVSQSAQNYPLHVACENGVWKMDYQDLLLMMETSR